MGDLGNKKQAFARRQEAKSEVKTSLGGAARDRKQL